MQSFDRVTLDPTVMDGKACIRGTRVTVGTVVGLLAAGHSPEEILREYPYLEPEDITQSLASPRGDFKNMRFPCQHREAYSPYNSTSKKNVRNEANDLPPIS